MLGVDHPIARAASARDGLRRQATANGALLAGVSAMGTLADTALDQALLSAIFAVEMMLLAGLVVATTCVRERAADAISAGDGRLRVAEIVAECERLGSSRHRAVLAARLAAAQHASKHWHEIGISKRPPPAICHLAYHEAIVTDVASLICEPAACLRGVAVLDWLLRGGYTAPLYCQPIDDVVRELGRIRYMLLAGRELTATGNRDAVA